MSDLDQSYTGNWGGGEVKKASPSNPGVPTNLPGTDFGGGELGKIGTGWNPDMPVVQLDPNFFGGELAPSLDKSPMDAVLTDVQFDSFMNNPIGSK